MKYVDTLRNFLTSFVVVSAVILVFVFFGISNPQSCSTEQPLCYEHNYQSILFQSILNLFFLLASFRTIDAVLYPDKETDLSRDRYSSLHVIDIPGFYASIAVSVGIMLINGVALYSSFSQKTQQTPTLSYSTKFLWHLRLCSQGTVFHLFQKLERLECPHMLQDQPHNRQVQYDHPTLPIQQFLMP